jgi:hypothetical protein
VTVHGGVPDFGPALGVRMGTTIEEAVTIFAAAQGASVQGASGETASTVLLSLGAQYFADRIALRAEIGAAEYEGPDARGSPTDATTGLPRGIGFVVGVGYELLRVRTSVFAIEASFVETFSQGLSVTTIVLAVAYQLY